MNYLSAIASYNKHKVIYEQRVYINMHSNEAYAKWYT